MAHHAGNLAPNARRLPRGVGRASLAWCAIALLASCQGSETQNRSRPLNAPVRSATRIFDEFLSPQAMARDLSQMQDRAVSMAEEEGNFGAALDNARVVGDLESQRLGAAKDATTQLLARELDRAGRMTDAEGLSVLDPSQDLAELRGAMLRLPRTLSLDRRPLGEPDDRQHRTDPWDNHPEAGWSSRILRRVLP
ncbi:MAG: hypothetical protein RLZZ562_1674 [Planctomycetota bacterium]|jgi:hypothetical protein